MPVTINNKPLYSVPEVAEAMGLTNQTVRSYIRSGKLQADRIGRAYLISEPALRAYLKLRQADQQGEADGWDLPEDTSDWSKLEDWELPDTDGWEPGQH
jgi:excisionase family DNA binding protein